MVATVALAGCGGGPDDQRAPAPPERRDAVSRIVKGEVRSPDARTPLVRGEGLWSCETTGSVELLVTEDGLATLFVRGRLLASVAVDRPLINRSCTAERPVRLPTFRAPRAAAGPSHLHCAVPPLVLVDLRDGDLVVREPARGRFLLGAAVGEQHLEPAGHWDTDCALATAG